MEYIEENERKTPVRYTCDVLVVGAGPAGAAAAIASARRGAKTLLVERYGFAGGMATAAGVTPFMTSYAGDTPIVGGVFNEVVERMVVRDAAIHPRDIYKGGAYIGWMDRGHDHITPFLPEELKFVLQEMLTGAGVEILFHSYCAGVIVEDSALRGVTLETKSGRFAVKTGVIVDATGDADVAFMSGAPTKKGRSADNRTQPMTLFFKMAGVDTDRLLAAIRSEGGLGAIVNEHRGEFISTREGASIFFSPREGEIDVNTTRVLDVDGTNVEDLTRAEIESRKQVQTLVRFFTKYFPGCENAYLLTTGTQIGVRETRRIIGEYILTENDVLETRDFPDTIARGSYQIDVHSPTDNSTVFQWLPEGKSYGIPYQCLVPLGVDNLLVAGRCISCTHNALGSVRVMPICFATGEAAGVAASLAAAQGVVPRNVNIDELQKALVDEGAIIRQD